MKKILVTGSTGLVGKYLQKILPDANYVSSKDYNLLIQSDVTKMFKELKPEIVIHLAARVGGVHHNIIEPVKYFEENIIMNTLIINESFKNNVKKFLGLLSSCIYPDNIDTYPIKENCLFLGAPHQDLFSYSYSKRCMAIQIDAYRKKYNSNFSYLIPCNLYGEFDKFDEVQGHFVGALINKILIAKKNNHKSIKLFGDGTPLRQFMHAKDLAFIIKEVVNKDIKENFNVGNQENYSILKIAQIALSVCEAENLEIEFDKEKPNGQLRKDIDLNLMNTLLPKFKSTLLKDGIKDVYEKIGENE
mgnify:FL=1